MRRYYITVGAKTTVKGTVVSGWHRGSINGQAMACEGDEVKCPECDSTGTIICVGPRLSEEWFGTYHEEIVQAFAAIEAGNITESVVFLAEHEQKNILQPAMYSNVQLVSLLLGNQFSHQTTSCQAVGKSLTS
jgi:hypothetical protein